MHGAQSQLTLTPLRQKTLEIHGGESFTDNHIRPGLHRVVAVPLGSPERARRIFEGREVGHAYTRISNETVGMFERRVAALEGAEAGLATASGMAAIDLITRYLAPQGHVVASNQLYGGVYYLLRELLPRFGINTRFVEDPHNPEDWEKAIIPGKTRFLYLETPSNPLIGVFDVSAIAEVAHRHELPLVVDSTLATPILLQPLSIGADIVIHSASKYMGNGEVIGGIILAKSELINDLRSDLFRDTGACISPDNAAIICSHLESLSSRMQEHCDGATKIADFLSTHPKVAEVFYPRDLVKKHMPNGVGGLMAFKIHGGRKEAYTVIRHLRIPWLAANIGETRSLVIHPATTTHGKMTPKEKAAAGITEGVIRYSVGREDPDDLLEDLDQALAHI